jgi:hypothetical protein
MGILKKIYYFLRNMFRRKEPDLDELLDERPKLGS